MPKPLTVWITTNWIILRDRNTRPPYLPLEKPVSRSRSDRTEHGTMDWFQIGKGVCLSCTLSPWLFNLYAEYVMRNAGLGEAQAGIKIARRNINNLRYAAEKALAPHSSTLAWRIPGTGEPGGLPSMGSHRFWIRLKWLSSSSSSSRYADDTTLMAESEEELKSLLMKVKEESEKAGLKLNIQ